MRLLILVTALHISTAFSATLDLDAFDYTRCLHWYMAADTGGAQSEAYNVALVIAKHHPQFSIFSAGAFEQNGRSIEKFGVCSYQNKAGKTEFYCLPNQNYPFAGATYKSTKLQKNIDSGILSCVSGCNKGVPESIHEMSQDIPNNAKIYEESEINRASKFHRLCEKS